MKSQNHEDLDTLLAEAEEAYGLLETLIHCCIFDFECDYEMGPLKTRERAVAKTVRRGISFDRVTDFARAAIIMPDDGDLPADEIANYIEGNFCELAGIVDKIKRPMPTGFRGYYIYPRLKNGHVTEILITTESMWAAYKQTHDGYERLCVIREKTFGPLSEDDQREVDDIMGKIRKIHERAITPAMTDYLASKIPTPPTPSQ